MAVEPTTVPSTGAIAPGCTHPSAPVRAVAAVQGQTALPAFLHRIYARVRAVGDCLEWSGPYMGATPCVYVPIDVLWPSKRCQRQSVRSALWCIANGRRAPKDQVIRPACQNHRCVKPDHWLVIDRKTQAKEQAKRGELQTIKRRVANIRKARTTGKLDAEIAAQIRVSRTPAREEAQRHGVTRSTITAIRRGQLWAEVVAGASPFVPLFAEVHHA